jgi:NADH-quinone oxidoreductase subunit A
VNVAWPIVGLGGIAFAFAAFSLVAGALAGPKVYNRAKLSAYECGIEPTPQPVGGGRFPIKYYLTAMLFIVFDIEIVFLYPWAVTFDQQFLSRTHMFGVAGDLSGNKWVLKRNYQVEFF